MLTTTKDRKITEEQKEFHVRAGKTLAPCWVECSSWAHSLMKQIFVGQEQRVIKTKDSCSQSYHFSRFGRDHSVRHACHGAHAGPGETFWDKHFRSYSGWDGRARRSGNKPEMSQELVSNWWWLGFNRTVIQKGTHATLPFFCFQYSSWMSCDTSKPKIGFLLDNFAQL